MEEIIESYLEEIDSFYITDSFFSDLKDIFGFEVEELPLQLQKPYLEIQKAKRNPEPIKITRHRCRLDNLKLDYIYYDNGKVVCIEIEEDDRINPRIIEILKIIHQIIIIKTKYTKHNDTNRTIRT